MDGAAVISSAFRKSRDRRGSIALMLLAAIALFFAVSGTASAAPNYPELTGRIVDNANLMMQAHAAYLDLLHRQLLPEGLVLWLFVCVRDDDFTSVPEKFQPTLMVLAELDENARFEFCAEMINELSERGAA